MNARQLERLHELLKKRNMASANIRHVEAFVRLKTLFLGTLTDLEWETAVHDALTDMERFTDAEKDSIADNVGVAPHV